MGAQLPMGTTHALLQKPCQRQAGSQACWVCSSHGLLNLAARCISRSACRAAASSQAQEVQGRCVGACAAKSAAALMHGAAGIHSGLHTCRRVTAMLEQDCCGSCAANPKKGARIAHASR